MQALPQLGRDDVLRLAGVAQDSQVERQLVSAAAGRGCLAAGMLATVAALSASGRPARSADAASQTSGGAAGSSLQLMQRLEQIEAEYQRRSAALELQSGQALEERMACYQRECEDRCRRQLERQVAEVRGAEVAAAREQDAPRHAAHLERERQTLQEQHQEKLARLRAQVGGTLVGWSLCTGGLNNSCWLCLSAALGGNHGKLTRVHHTPCLCQHGLTFSGVPCSWQEDELLERSRRLQREAELARETHLQRMAGEEEAVRLRRAEADSALAARRAELERQQDALAHRQRLAAAHQQEAQQRVEARQAELERREEQVSGQRASVEAARGQLSALRQQVAALEGETAALRLTLQQQEAGHAQEKRDWGHQHQQLVEDCRRLRQQLREREEALQRLEKEEQREQRQQERTAGGLAAALSPEDAARLQQAVRRLMRQQEDLLQEVQAGRARERLWRGAASAGDHLVDKTAGWQEQALQQCEDLRLALAAAEREVADLQQQAEQAGAAWSCAEVAPGLAPLLNSAREVGQWREGARHLMQSACEREENLRSQLARLRAQAAANRGSVAQQLQRLLAARTTGRASAGADSEGGLGAEPAPGTFVGGAAPGSELTGSPESEHGLVPAASPTPLHTVHARHMEAGPRHGDDDPAAADSSQLGPGSRPSSASGSTRGDSGPGAGSSQPQPRLHTHPAPVSAAAAGGATADDQQGPSLRAPVSRTTSDILAAYRARQQQAAATASSQPPLRKSPLVQAMQSDSDGRSSNEEQGGEEGEEEGLAPDANGRCQPALAGRDGSRRASTEEQEEGLGDSFYISHGSLTDDDSKF